INALLKGEIWAERIIISKLVSQFVIGTKKKHLSNTGLTEREKHIIKLVVKGYSNKKIGKELSISESTVKNHLVNIYKKLSVHNRYLLALLFQDYALDN
ncbi:MAG: LuxR C-terminal-related transcriptional regulator, partial [Nitrososphaeraceae archaeon]|nr:LuxR C-terminal-related transcriptional regulator [Nitrososphaeraceae archaeon]